MPHQQPSAVKGFLAGAVGGAVATSLLNVFQKTSLEATRSTETALGTDPTYTHQQEELLATFEKAHTETAEKVADAAQTGLSEDQRRHAAPVVEYLFGALCGGVYGVLAEYLPSVTSGFGTAYGTILFVGASEVVLPALGMVPPPQERTPIQHFGGLAGNVVYGAGTEGVRRVLRSLL